ncbi:Scr1 family TA system antitoxin-like transcriptional regulator [Streptomyces sp. MspMP-M5]|uniref:Scr1 family TA system antitoxin-like transcriptional regulator n=1 Tax=unclassified Streptomyces TaxID=2593676 RepID=UPI00036D2B91|nr:Scr1 family TA system antitoxin-like transcriptional regulator [Streptomyces sp. MspMP-M5]MYT33283.1 helix-turn-helix domain-containing protein [Streptomyces sp. SID8354]
MAIEPDRLGRTGLELAAMLRHLRSQAGLSGVRLAARCHMSQSKISRIEGGKLRPSLVDVEQILRGLSVSPAVAAEVLAIARIAQTEWQDRKALHRKGLDKKQSELAGLEAVTTDFRYFMLSMATGLLATPDYIRESIAHAPPAQQAKAIGMKLQRQAVLLDHSKRFTFLLTEQAIRYPLVSSDAMALQIDRLASLTLQSNIRLGILPIGVRFSNTPLSTFTVYDDRLATIETDLGAAVFRDPKDVRSLLDRFTSYAAHAVYGDDARQLLTTWAWSFRQ